MVPNLFHYATSELSQDAVLCWMAAWSAPECNAVDPDLHQLGKGFLDLLLDEGWSWDTDLHNREIKRQYNNIDILLIINKTVAVCIEDKAGSIEHSGQLERYVERLAHKYDKSRIFPVYIQTGEQCDYLAAENAGYKVVRRGNLLQLLSEYVQAGGTNAIARDFHDHLLDIQRRVESFQRPLEDWDDLYGWHGFFDALRDELKDGEWGYVPNPSGGFTGYWWSWYENKENGSQLYLQLEQDLQLEQGRLCVKLAPGNDIDRGAFGRSISERLLSVSLNSRHKFLRPSRIRGASTMTIGRMDGDYRRTGPDGALDFPATVAVIRHAERILGQLASQSSFARWQPPSQP